MAVCKYIKINERDNAAPALQDISAGAVMEEGLSANQDIPQAHKIALCDIPKGGEVIRYGVVLGYAKEDIRSISTATLWRKMKKYGIG